MHDIADHREPVYGVDKHPRLLFLQVMDSTKKLVECVPNFSEGCSTEVIQAIADAIRNVEGCHLLDVEPGTSTNRTVYTFVGSPEVAVLGALSAARAAFKLIDMAKHKGEHPRMGALDVCPFIPLMNTTTEDCIACSKQFGEALAGEFGVPVFLYEYAATAPHRKHLADIRKGEYEGMEEKLKNPEWKPDFGPDKFVPSWGATAVGARKFLIAYNVNILATKNQAHRIALIIRESGKGSGEHGPLKNCKAIGWFLEEEGLAQVSMNLTDFEVTNMHHAFEECKKVAQELNIPVVGSELVGLVPLKCILDVADFYIKRDNLFLVEEKQRLRLVVDRLGLNSLRPFNPEEKIIEYKIGATQDGPLVSSSVRSFVEQLGARTSAPGGGSASALVATVGASLGTMVGWMTYGWKKFESVDSIMRQSIGPLYQAMQGLLPLVDADSAAFGQFQAASCLPKASAEEKHTREVAMQDALRAAIEVPLSVVRVGNSCWPHLVTLAQHGNISTKSDLQVAAHSLRAGVRGAVCNVEINLAEVSDKDYKEKVMGEVKEALSFADNSCAKVLSTLDER